jgi:NAD(P)-dependent dehydrogenase (short-subunit alcohol dehydrogenase family)
MCYGFKKDLFEMTGTYLLVTEMNTLSTLAEGKICLVMGASSPIAHESARALASLGARVLLLGRKREYLNAQVEQIREQTGNDAVDYILADLASLGEVREAAEIVRRYARLDVLINAVDRSYAVHRESPEGIEMTLAANYLGPFLLTNLLLEILKASIPARVINITPVAGTHAELSLDEVDGRPAFDPRQAYQRSHEARLMFTLELARMLQGSGVNVNALNPGWKTAGPGIFKRLARLGGVKPAEAAQSVVYLALSDEVEGVSGQYFELSAPKRSAQEVYDAQLAERLWRRSAELTDLPIYGGV